MDEKLAALSRNQNPAHSPPSRSPTTARLISLGPWLLGAAVLFLVVVLFGRRFLPAAAVEIETVVTASAENTGGNVNETFSPGGSTDPYNGSTLFQASGWFEADPFPYRATALTSGVVETVHVLEGQTVEVDEPIATLIQEDAELRFKKAKANVSSASASVEAAKREFALGQARIESMRHQVQVAEARGEELADLAKRALQLGPEVMAEQDIVQAELRLQTQLRLIASLEAQLQERSLESERLGETISVMQGRLSQAQVQLQEAQLEFDRTVVRSPVQGTIQRLMVAPGQKKVLMADNPESATVALLYQPESMQARIDVPISEAEALRVGQAVLLESEFIPGIQLQGVVQRINGEADLQRNTLQVKVRIANPPPSIRPEILCRARFLDSFVADSDDKVSVNQMPHQQSADAGGLTILVPREALIADSGNASAVWAVDESGKRIERRSLSLTGEERDSYLIVKSGLRPGDRVVVNPGDNLREGTRIKY